MSEKRFELSKDKGFIFDNLQDDFLDLEDDVNMLNNLYDENEQLRQLLAEYRKTNKHLSELCADASKNGYLPPLEDLQ